MMAAERPRARRTAPASQSAAMLRRHLSRGALLRLVAGAGVGLALRARGARAGGFRIRKNVRALTPEERRRFIAAVQALKGVPSPHDPGINAWDFYVRLHLSAYYDEQMPAHMAPAFGPWHRWFVLLLENDLQRVDPTVTLPYWDWSVDRARDQLPWTDDFLGGNGDPAAGYVVTSGPFRRGEWPVTVIDPQSQHYDPALPFLQRDFGTYVSGGLPQTTLPTAAEVEAALAIPIYDVAPWDAESDYARSFRNNLEGFRRPAEGSRLPAETHNRVHNWVGGSMSEGSSPNDPAFYLVHAFVDLLFAEWLRRYGPAYQPVSSARFHQNLNDPLWYFESVTPAMLLDHRALGYIYDRELV